MKSDVAPRPGRTALSRQALSSVRTTVVPTAVTGRPSDFAAVIGLGRRGRDRVRLFEHPVVLDELRPDGLEGGQADVEGDAAHVDPPVARAPAARPG